jgi:cell division protein FtsB
MVKNQVTSEISYQVLTVVDQKSFMRIMDFKRFEFLVSFGCLVLLGYFAWTAFYGPRGYPYRELLEKRIAVLTTELNDISTQRHAIEARVTLMRPESIDPDMLDELARKTLDLAASNEVTVKLAN